MNKIENQGNLPKHMRIFAKQLGGQLSNINHTDFYEMSSVSEFEKGASGELDENLRYEIVPTIDKETGRGFLVGFDAEQPKQVITLQEYAKLKVYFIEITESELKEWIKKIDAHRKMQQKDMYQRRDRAAKRRIKRRKKND